MSNNSVCYLLFFGWINLEWFGNFMNHNFTSVLWLGILIQNLDDIKFFFTAPKLIIRTKRSMKRHLDLWLALVHVTVSHFSNMIIDIASFTPKNIKITPNLPVNFSPWDSICFSNESYKFFEVPCSVDNMLGSDLSVIVNVSLTLVAVKNRPLVHGK